MLDENWQVVEIAGRRQCRTVHSQMSPASPKRIKFPAENSYRARCSELPSPARVRYRLWARSKRLNTAVAPMRMDTAGCPKRSLAISTVQTWDNIARSARISAHPNPAKLSRVASFPTDGAGTLRVAAVTGAEAATEAALHPADTRRRQFATDRTLGSTAILFNRSFEPGDRPKHHRDFCYFCNTK